MRFNPLILSVSTLFLSLTNHEIGCKHWDIGMRCVRHKLYKFKQVFEEHKIKQKVYGPFRGDSRSDFSKEKSRNRTP
ncbi:hypothetical protein Hanom_Chr06g00491131 [Helianthus anomalus]